MIWVHLTFRAAVLPIAVTHHLVAPRLWERLRETFPDVASGALMPDHGHVVALVEDASEAGWRLGRVLNGLRRTASAVASIVWRPVEAPGVIQGLQKLARQARYVSLNPSRAGLIDDPLWWPWSTHRDVVGAVVDPWVKGDWLASLLGFTRESFVARFHAYVSADPSSDVSGTSLPQRRPLDELGLSLPAIAAAAAAATRAHPHDIRHGGVTRDLFVHLTHLAGWRDARVIGVSCNAHASTIRRILARPLPSAHLAAGTLSLSDPRLRAWSPDGVPRPRPRSRILPLPR